MVVAEFWDTHFKGEASVPIDTFVAALCGYYNLDRSIDETWLLDRHVSKATHDDETLDRCAKHGLFIYVQTGRTERFIPRHYFEWACRRNDMTRLTVPEHVAAMRACLMTKAML